MPQNNSEMAAPTFSLSEKSEITVEHGPFGHYVLFNKNGSRVSLSRGSWRVLRANKSQICAHIVTDKPCEFKFNEKKKVKVSSFNEFMIVSIVEKDRRMNDGKIGDVHVNLTAKEWDTFMGLFHKVDAALHTFVTYRSDANEWTMLIPDEWIERMFHEAPDNRSVELLLAGYLIEIEIYRQAKKDCRACFMHSNEKNSFINHEDGCGMKFDVMVDKYFDDVFERANMDDAFGKLSTFIKRFYFPPTDAESKSTVKDVVKDPSYVDDWFPNFVPAMRNTFRALQLNMTSE